MPNSLVIATLNPGNPLYLDSGEEVLFVCAIGDDVVVRRQVEDGEGDFVPSNAALVVDPAFLYLEPPKGRLAASLAGLASQHALLEGKIQAASRELADLRSQLAVSKEEMANRREALHQHHAFELVEDFLAGRITHLVEIPSYSAPRVLPLDEALQESNFFGGSSNRRGELRLLSLFGASKGDLTFRRNRYSDGSGSWEDIFPVRSLAEAREVVAREMEKRYVETREKRNGHLVDFEKTEAVLEKLGLSIPADLVRIHLQSLLDHALKESSVADEKKAAAKKAGAAALARLEQLS